MNIVLNNEEFNEAVELYLNSLGFSTDKYNIEVRIVAGRNGNGTKAEVSIEKKSIDEINATLTEPEKETEIITEPESKPNTIGNIFGSEQ